MKFDSPTPTARSALTFLTTGNVALGSPSLTSSATPAAAPHIWVDHSAEGGEASATARHPGPVAALMLQSPQETCGVKTSPEKKQVPLTSEQREALRAKRKVAVEKAKMALPNPEKMSEEERNDPLYHYRAEASEVPR